MKNEPKPTPHWLVRLFLGLTFAGLMATVATYLLPVATGADVGGSGGMTRTAALAVTVAALLAALISSALLKPRDPGA